MAESRQRLEKVVTNIVDMFEEYGNEDKKKLTSEELKTLLESEIKSPELKERINPDDIVSAMDVLDKNNDGEINFGEFCKCVTLMAKSYYHKKTGNGGKKGKGKDKGKDKGKGKDNDKDDETEDA